MSDSLPASDPHPTAPAADIPVANPAASLKPQGESPLPVAPEPGVSADPLTPLLVDRQARLVLSDPRPSAPPGVRRISCEPVIVRGEPQWQLAYFTATQVTHRNLPRRAIGRELDRLASQFQQAQLHTPTQRLTLRPPRQARQPWRIVRHDPVASPPPLPATHNRQPNHPLPEGVPCPFLIEIGVMTPAGQVRSSRQAKFRQVNRFLELVHDLLTELPAERPLRIIDFGCGKSYLTFALHHWLTGPLGRQVEITGLDRRADVIADCAEIAHRLGCTGLRFEQGSIAEYQPAGPVDLVVALHACDTATDDALAQAIAWRAGAILAVPCCQHELAPQLGGPGLAALLRHGILRERFAALATDALRAGVLELAGYATQVVEFVDLEHTAKNLLLRARRRETSQPPSRPATDGASPAPGRAGELLALKSALELGSTHLERRLAELGCPLSPGPEASLMAPTP